MSKLQKWISVLLCACLLTSAAAFAEQTAPTEEVSAAVASTATELQDDTVLATVNGAAITWADLKGSYESLVQTYGTYYDMAKAENVDLFRAVALENEINEMVLLQQAKANGFDQLTEEERAELITAADSDWDLAINNYIEQNALLTEESSEEEKAQAKAAAEAYYFELGYTQEILRDEYLKYDLFDRIEKLMTQDATVTDEEIEADYQAKVAADKALYENDLSAYLAYNGSVDQMEMYAQLYGTENEMDYAWYRPAGFRAVKHILLAVDETLMSKYKDLQSRLEEQMDDEASAVQDSEPVSETTADATAADATPEPTQEPVTQADVDSAKADILASLADKIDEINQKIADGVSFEELITTYGVDPGMSAEPYQTNGYEVAQASTNYYPEFVDAVFSVNNIGEVSAPYLTDVGVHIVKYIGDVAAGAIEMTAEQREAKRATLLDAKKSDLFSEKLEAYLSAASITYTGVIPSIAELEARETAAEDDAVTEEAELPEEEVLPEE